MEKKLSQEFLRKRKMLLLFPLIVIPLLSIIFYGLGGGKATPLTGEGVSSGGYNTNLPGAKFGKQDKNMDKVSAYRKADQDSAKLKDQLREDPYHAGGKPTATTLSPFQEFKSIRPGKDSATVGLRRSVNADTTADVVIRRLERPQATLKQPPEPAGSPYSGMPAAYPAAPPQTARLEQLMQQLKPGNTGTSTDPQLEKLNGMLDKIMQIQHPDAALVPKDSGLAATGRPASYDVQKFQSAQAVSELEASADRNSQQAFYTLEDETQEDSISGNVITAIVEGDQTLVSGGTIGGVGLLAVRKALNPPTSGPVV